MYIYIYTCKFYVDTIYIYAYIVKLYDMPRLRKNSKSAPSTRLVL